MAIQAYDKSKAAKIEELITLKQHRAKPVGEFVSKRFLPGDSYKQSGIEKIEVLARGLAAVKADFKGTIEKGKDRVAPKNPQLVLNPIVALVEAVTKLVNKMDEFIELKKR